MNTNGKTQKTKILLTGTTGYIGGRLRRTLEEQAVPVRCMTRRPEFLRPRVSPTTEVVRGDVADLDSLRTALEGIETAFYLVHSMESNGDFEESDRIGSSNFAQAAKECGVRRIIYLGGLGHGEDLSSHLSSRQEVGEILRNSGIPTIELRASIVIGSGSLSFEMIRALVNELPVMITPRWVYVKAQPIAIEDVISYLVESMEIPLEKSEVFEIGGADQVSYAQIMHEYARQRGLKRLIIPVPVLTLRLSSLWLGLVTPIYARTGRKLIDSVRNETVVNDDRALRVFSVRPRGIGGAIRRALINEDQEFAETRWSDALSSKGYTSPYGGKFGARLVDSRSRYIDVSPAEAFRPIQRIGGDTGWYYANWLWTLRGFLDLLVGGVGIRRGRRHPEEIAPGDTIDFWRVESVQPNRLLRLFAEMKTSGRAWLQFEVEKSGEGCTIRQTAVFDPSGLTGLLYWYSLYGIHHFVFSGMLRNICQAAEEGVNKVHSGVNLQKVQAKKP